MISVVNPAANQDLATTAQVKADLAITTTTDDALLANMIRQASAMVADYCNRVFISERVRETVGSDGGPLLFLSRTPLVTLHEIRLLDDLTLVDAASYTVDDDLWGSVRALRGFWRDTGVPVGMEYLNTRGPQRTLYRVEYTGGYAADKIPQPVQRATIELTKALYSARDRDPYLESLQVPDVVNKSWGSGAGRASLASGGLPPVVAVMLNPYRRVSL